MTSDSSIIKRGNEILTAAGSKELAKLKSSSLLERLKNKTALLIDTSGSMADLVGATTKHQIMLDLIKDVQSNRVFTFDSQVREITNNKVNLPSGGTNMALAFERMHQIKAEKVILITDGMPDSPARALETAKGLNLVIIYVGPDPAPIFLESLAAASGGEFKHFNLLKSGSELLLKAAVKGLLN